MSNQKNSKYVITQAKPNRYDPNKDRTDAPPPDMLTNAMYMDKDYPQGAFYLECAWFWKAYPDKV
jgi:hypothetical protein